MVREIRQGDVYWFDFGFADGSAPAEKHPCVVVQSDIFNRTALATTVVCLITSNLKRASAPGNVVLKKGVAHLTRPSVVNVTQLLTVDKIDLEEKLGCLPNAALKSVLTGLRLLFEGASHI